MQGQLNKTQSLISTLYEAKCKDIGVEPKEQHKTMFSKGLTKSVLNRRLDVSQQMMSINGVGVIARIVSSEQIMHLDLSKNPIGLAGMKELAKTI